MANKRGPKQRGETPITFDDYKTFAFLKSSIVTEVLAEVQGVINRTALVEKWYQLAQLDVWWMLRDAATANDDNPELQKQIWDAMDTINKVKESKNGL